MSTIKIAKDELVKYGLPDWSKDGVEVIEDKVIDNSRWSIDHELIFKWIDGNTYLTYYSVGATEMQDESPWEYEKEVECTKVEFKEVLAKQWVEVE